MSSCPRERSKRFQKPRKNYIPNVVSGYSVDQPNIQRGSERPGKESKQLLDPTSSSGFGDPASEASGEGRTTLGASPGPAVSSPKPGPARPRGAPSSPCPGPADAGRLGNPGAAADQLRPAGPRLSAPPGPPERGPRPRGAERAGAARRAELGAPAALTSPLKPGLRAAGRAPGYSPVAEEGLRGMGPLALPLLPERPVPRIGRAATGPGAGTVPWEPQPPPPLLGRGVVSLTQEEPPKQPPPF